MPRKKVAAEPKLDPETGLPVPVVPRPHQMTLKQIADRLNALEAKGTVGTRTKEYAELSVAYAPKFNRLCTELEAIGYGIVEPFPDGTFHFTLDSLREEFGPLHAAPK